MLYLWAKSLHIVFVMAWVAAVFYLPRILVNVVEAGPEPAIQERLVLMGKRLYRFGWVTFGIAAVLGLTLWLHFGITGAWLHAKLGLVAAVIGYYVWNGRLLAGVGHGGKLPTARMLRLSNELPVFVIAGIVYLVVSKSL